MQGVTSISSGLFGQQVNIQMDAAF